MSNDELLFPETLPPPPAALPPPATAAAAPHVAAPTFTGRGSEYFRIWVVNVLLTLVTFGVYSAWAKVRKARYEAGAGALLTC